MRRYDYWIDGHISSGLWFADVQQHGRIVFHWCEDAEFRDGGGI